MKLIATYYYHSDDTVPLNSWFSNGIREYGLTKEGIGINTTQQEYEYDVRHQLLLRYPR